MPQSLANVLVHLVFSTKERRPDVDGAIEAELHRYLATACRSCGCPALQVGGTQDHIHILLSLSRTITIGKLVESIKTDSSKWVKTKGAKYELFSWQGGYGAFSIGASQIEKTRRYITGQKEHHEARSFKDEFRALLRAYGIEWDERYVWG
jgi:REP element-mobilizing transposase RayT